MAIVNHFRRRGLAFEQCEPRIALSADTPATTLNLTFVGGNLEGGFIEFDYTSNGKIVPGQLLNGGTNVIIGDGIIVNGIGTNGSTTAKFSDSLNSGDLKPATVNFRSIGVPASRRPNGVAEAKFAPKLIPVPVASEPSEEGGSIDLVALRSDSLNDVDPSEEFSKELFTQVKEEALQKPAPTIVTEAAEAESLRGRAVLMEVAVSATPTLSRDVLYAVADRAEIEPISLRPAVLQRQEHDGADDEANLAAPISDSTTDLAKALVTKHDMEATAQSPPRETSPSKLDPVELANSAIAARDRAFAEMEGPSQLAVAAVVSDPKSRAFTDVAAAVVLVAIHSYRGFRAPGDSRSVEQRPPRRGAPNHRIRSGGES